jgi:hypothetical protein
VARLDSGAPAQDAVNPFSDGMARGGPGKEAFGDTSFAPDNPYASPAAFAYDRARRGEDARTGPPWESDGQSVGTFFSTVGLVFGQTNVMFLTMRRRGGLGAPLGFAVVGNIIGVLATAMYELIGLPDPVNLVRGGPEPDMAVAPLGIACGTIVCAPIIVILALFLHAFLVHLALMLVGGSPRGFDDFETTFRVICYCDGATMLIAVLPVCGQWLQIIVQTVFVIIGLAAAHETSIGTAALAALLPLIVCCGLLVAVGVFVGFVALAA